MSILDTVFRRREPAVKYRTIDGGNPAPYPDMTDEQLYNYEMTFNVPKKTFDKRPDVAAPHSEASDQGGSEQRSSERLTPTEMPATASRTAGPRTNSMRSTTGGRSGQSRPGAARASTSTSKPEPELASTRPLARDPVLTEQISVPSQLDLSKPVRTVTTRQPVEIITTRARHPLFKVLGYIGEDQVVTMFTLDGQISENGPRFLENVPQKQTLYLNVYPNRSMGGRERFFLTQHESKEAADAAATVERIACIPVEFEL